MAILFEGPCKGKAIDAEVGAKDGKPNVRWNMSVVEGPHVGKTASYSGKLDPENIKYTKRDMIAIGWKPGPDGKYDIRTFVADVARADLVVPFMAEVASYTKDNGKTSSWTSARSIGFAARPLDKLDDDKTNDVNSWFAEVPDEAPSSSNGEAPKAQSPIPF